LVKPDQAIKLWDMNTLQCTNTLLGHKSDIWCLQFDATQQMIVSGSGYEGARLSPSFHPSICVIWL
jgi:WD40 repeat protein